MFHSKIEPGDFENCLETAETDMFCGELYSAVHIIKTLIRSEEIPKHLKNRVYYQAGILSKLLGNYEDAVKYFGEVIDNGGQEEIILHKASALNFLGRHREALNILTDLTKTYDTELYWETTGIAYLGTGAPSEATKAFVNLKRINPENIMASKLLAISLLKIGNYNASEKESKKILERFPEDLESGLILTWSSLFTERELDALETLSSIEANGDRRPELYFAMSALNYLAGSNTEARKIMLEASKREPFTSDLQRSITMQIVSSALTSAASENVMLEKEVMSFKEQLIDVFTNMLLEKNFFLGDKCRKISETAYLMAKCCDELSETEKEDIRIAGAICNLGMLYMPSSIITKTTPLTSAEKDTLKEHAIKTTNILKPFVFLKNITEAVKYHHEKYDGSGYPYKLKGEDIPFSARIVAIADFFTDITNDNPRQKGVPPTSAVKSIQTLTGSFFCPKAFELLKKVYH